MNGNKECIDVDIQKEKIKEQLLEAVLKGEEAEPLLWEVLIIWQETAFKTASGLPFTYTIRKGKRGQLTKELWIDRRESSKSLSFGSIRMAFKNACQKKYVSRPKEMGDIRGVSYMYSIFWRMGIIEVPQKYAEKMKMDETQENGRKDFT